MKTNKYTKVLAAAAIVLAASACDENSWNDKLDGFDKIENEPVTDVQTVEYTLTDADYKTIAGLAENTALAGEDGKAALQQVGSMRRFSQAAPASKYVPAFLGNSSFPYFTLTDGSAIRLTYRQADAEPEEYIAGTNPQTYRVSPEQYEKDVWQSENFINAFAPSKQPQNFIPTMLAADVDPADGSICVVTYNVAPQEPVFGGGTPEEPSFELSSVVGSLKNGDAGVTIRGVVMAVCAQGYMLADKTGAIFVYMGSKFDTTTVAVGDQMEVNGSIGAYNKGLQVTGSSATATVLGKQDITYPAAKEYTGAELDQAITRTDDALGIYATIKGKVTMSYDKEDPTKLKNINIVPAGSAKAQGSVYGFTPEVTAMLKDGSEQTITGYFIAIAGSKYCNMVVTEIDGKSVNSAAARMMSRAGLDVFAETHSTVYHYSANRWSVADNFSVLSPDDYTAMGRPTGDLTAAEPYLSQYVNSKYPYGNEGDIRYVIWNHYAGGETSFACAAFKRGTSAWEPYDFTITETNQFVRTGGKWMYDPNVTINLPAGKGQEMSTLYFQTCVDWVYENICRPLGDTDIKSGKFYISSYGNNEYYSGTSAYQGNIDLRPSAARSQYPAGYEGMSDDQIIELEKTRFMKEVMPGALSILHSDAKPIEGLSVLYTINFSAYYESKETIAYTAVFEVSGPGQFAPVSCTWWEDGKIPQ